MLNEPAAPSRNLRSETISADFVIVGGGIAGTCAAITAARAGAKTVLIQDRPVLGGNASSEVRLWTLGATAHMGAPQRWSREGGVLDEIMLENLYRNPEGNAIVFDTVLLEKVVSEPNISLLLNAAVYEVDKSDADTILSVTAICSQNSTLYKVSAPLFCDASGDGILGFLSGAAFRMGAESKEESGEKFAPNKAYGELLGHSIYFYSKNVGRPVKYIPPSYALDDIKKIPRYRQFKSEHQGCNLWWIEWGGRLDTVHETETIKWELWKVVYGVWNYIKNSGAFPDAENLTLEWVGTIPGKRESRRFEGDYMMRQQDVIEQREHYDAVAFGGWALDLHPADGIYSDLDGCTHWRPRGVYQIPFRSMYSRNVKNLFLAGRIISVSHVAFGSTRVMATLGLAAQAVGMAAAICTKDGSLPSDLSAKNRIGELQLELIRSGQHIPRVLVNDPDDLAQTARISATSSFKLDSLPDDGPLQPLNKSWAQMLPLVPGKAPKVTFTVNVESRTTLELELRASLCADNHTADKILATKTVALGAGKNQTILADFDAEIDETCYGFYALTKNEDVRVHTSESRISGILSVTLDHPQAPPADIGVDTFEIWSAKRQPNGQNLAMKSIEPPIESFGPDNAVNGWQRPTNAPNVWCAALDDPKPSIMLSWETPQTISRIELFFDGDYDHPLETVLWGHPERAVPFCVKQYVVRDGDGNVLAERTDNHLSRNTIVFHEPISTSDLMIELVSNHSQSHQQTPLALMQIRCYEK